MSNESSTPSPDTPSPKVPPAPGAPGPGAPAPSAAPSAAPPATPLKPGLAQRIKRFFLYWIGGLLLAAVLWTVFSLNWRYADGDRGGVLQRFSKTGWLCKTYEGELAMYVIPGMAPEVWQFSVRDDKVAQELAGFVGERVQLHYSEHRGLPTSCFGETAYFVDRVTPAPPAPSPPPAPASVEAPGAPAPAGPTRMPALPARP
jgi:hypothetical protein